MRRLPIFLSIMMLAQLFFPHPATKVDFLAPLGLKANAAGPLLVRMDETRNRLVVANTLSSAVTLIDCGSRAVRNIPVSTRVPQYLKAEALAIDSRSGTVYVIGDHTLEVVFPERGEALTFPTKKQFEMVAVDEANGNAFLVGRESRDLAWVELKKKRIRYIPWCEQEESAQNLNQTPPPPLRKVVCDSAARIVAAVDGFRASLQLYSADGLAPLRQRTLALEPGGRWHFAGYAPSQKAIALVVETTDRRVIQAAKVSIAAGPDVIVPLPGLSEGVGIRYSAGRDELYVPYDNHPSLHVVDFKEKGKISEVRLPAYGNDATAIDEAAGLLYVASWAWGEIDQVDLNSRTLRRRFFQPAVLPHMFHMEFNANERRLYIPLGATAVNGAFGAAITAFDPERETLEKIRIGWAPQELLPLPGNGDFLVFSNEDQMARVSRDGKFTLVNLPVLYPHQALPTPSGWVYLSYGPHQSYWPVVYIWGARNGILGIKGDDLALYDRRIPRLAQAMTLSPAGNLYALQNNWGDEKQFYVTLGDEVRAPNLGDMRVELPDTVSRETTQRLAAYDEDKDWLLMARVGERDVDNGVLQVVDARTGKAIRRLEVGITPTALAADSENIYVANFDSDSLAVFRKEDFSRRDIPCGRQPLKLALAGGGVYVINHGDNTLSEVAATVRRRRIPFPGTPDQLAARGDTLLITSHSASELFIIAYDVRAKEFSLLHREEYPYGQVSFNGGNSSFFVRGQFGDCVYDLCHVRWDRRDGGDTAWVSDFLSGKVFIVPLK